MPSEYQGSDVYFSPEQYQQLRQTYRQWWDNTLHRPIVPIAIHHCPTHIKKPQSPLLGFSNSWDPAICPRQFIEAAHYELSATRWYGEAFPFVQTDPFGPGVMAAFLGCTPQNAPNTVWFHPPKKDIPIEELHFEYDENNPYLRRVLDFYEAAMEKWRGQVVVSMVDLGGPLDVLACFRGTQNLLLDFYDAPEEVMRCTRELQQLWFAYFSKINQIMAPEAQGYSHWYSIYNEKPSYILQSDLSYMISKDMFDQFALPELSAAAGQLYQATYHMDGVGQINHLDSLLAMDHVKGIQWVPGDGTPLTQNWDDLLERILSSGKKLLSFSQNPDGSPIALAKDPGQLLFPWWHYGAHELEQARRYGEMYCIEIDC